MIKKILTNKCENISYIDNNDIRHDIFIFPMDNDSECITISCFDYYVRNYFHVIFKFDREKYYDVIEYLTSLKDYELRLLLEIDSDKDSMCKDIIKCLKKKKKDLDIEKKERERLIDLLRTL